MSKEWFKVAIRFQEVVEDDRVKTIIEEYLFQSISYSDAEYKALEMFQSRNQNVEIHKVTKTNLSEVFISDEDLETWWQSVVQYIIFDEKTKQEKRTAVRFLLNSRNIETTYKAIVDKLGQVEDYEITEIKKTKVLEVYGYEETDQDKVNQGNFKPLNEVLGAQG